MNRIGRGFLPAVLVAGLLLLPGGSPAAAPEKPDLDAIAQLGAVREQCVAAARAVQRDERSIAALELAIGVMERGAAAQQRRLEQGGKEQEQLLGALERLARAPPEALAFAPEGPVDRVRSGILIAAAVPALREQAKSLSGQLAALAAERAQIGVRRSEIDGTRQTLSQARAALAALVARRAELIGRLLPNDGKTPGGEQIGGQASDIADLIRRADVDADRRGKELLLRLTGGVLPPKKNPPPQLDPTRPADLRALDAPRATMVWSVSGELVHRFGEAEHYGRPSQGLTMSVAPTALVVAPADGQVDFVGTFRDYGLILIIRHGAGYHSLLAGFGQVDVTSGQWLLAGEPVGAVPGVGDKNASATFYMELRRDGRPIDPQSRLASRDDKTEDSPGNSKVGE